MGVTVVKGSEMRYSSAALFAALMVWGSTSPVFACRSENNATVFKLADRFVSAGPDQYNIKLDASSFESFRVGIGPSHDVGFCVDVSVLDSSDIQNTITGVMFWKAIDNPTDGYFIYIRNDQYQITHQLFGEVYELIPWTTDASIKKGPHQKNEVDVRVTAKGADIQINGTELTNIVARPSADVECYYGVVFMAPKTGAGLFQVGSPRVVK
jgi:hypothetical protein